MFTDGQMRFLSRLRVAHLATADAGGQPHAVPIVFASDGRKLYTPLDDKPKTRGARELKRVRNVIENPQVAVVLDEYNEDWTKLAWLMVRGHAEIVEGGELHASGVRLLHAKYPQYRSMPLNDRPIIVVTPARVTSWGAL